MNKIIYKQADSRWGSKPYPTKASSFAGNGCGCCACTHLVIEQDKYKNYTPENLRPWMVNQGFAYVNQGTSWSGIKKTLEHYGYKVVHIGINDPMSKAWTELNKGNRIGVILFLGGRGPNGTVWTAGGHYVAFTDYKVKDGKHYFYTKDSGGRNHDGWYTYENSMKGLIYQMWIVEKINTPAPKPKPTPTPTPSGKLPVNGKFDKACVKVAQKLFGTAQDGTISGQLANLKQYHKGFDGNVKYGTGGSAFVKALQKYLGLSGPDGYLGPNTIKALQKMLGVSADGIWGPDTSKAFQKWLNSNKTLPAQKKTSSTKIKGMDISAWQGKISVDNFKKAKASGIQFVILRVGYTGSESNKPTLDNSFENNYKNAIAAGLPVGAYFYSLATTDAKAKEEANFCIKQLKGKKITYPVYIDVEDPHKQAKQSKATLASVCNTFCKTIKAANYKPGVYANISWFNNKIGSITAEHSKWVAQYYSKCEYKGAYDIWQYSSSEAVPGIGNKIDVNYCYKKFSGYDHKAVQNQANNISKEQKQENTKQATNEKKNYSGSYPTAAEIKTASNNGARASMLKWPQDIVASGKYKYKRFTDDPKTHQCPICHPGSGNGWNCMGYAIASWRHGSKLPCNCSCAWMGDGEWDKILKMNDADALAYAQKKTGLKDVKVIRNGGKTIPNSQLQAGDILGLYDGNDIQHIVLYIGDGKITDSTSGRKPNIAYGVPMYKEYQAKVAIRYTGGHDYMQFYDRGTGVKKIKDYLEWYDPKNKFADDDVFGTGTETAVKEFQEKEVGKGQGDGFVGQKTIDAMKKVKK